MKDLFLLDPGIIFLNHGSFGACPVPVFERYQAIQRELERNPVEFLGRRSGELLGAAREVLAAYVGAAPSDLVFVPNATHGVNAVARSMDLAAGDEVLASDQEYGACDSTWEFVCAARGARYVHAEIPLPFRRDEFEERIWARVTPRTRVLFLSHVVSSTALLFPIAKLVERARAAGILTVIDGAHVPGQFPLDLRRLGADFYTGNCHKWLCAPKGAAFLFVRTPHHARIHGNIVSWGYAAEVSGHTGFDAYTGTTVLERRLQWQGTRDIAPFLAVPSAIEFQAAHDWDTVRARCHSLAAVAQATVASRFGLAPIGEAADFGQMVALPVPLMDPTELKTTLFDRYRIEVPVTFHAGRLFVRISVQGYNDESDVDALVRALFEIYGVG